MRHALLALGLVAPLFMIAPAATAAEVNCGDPIDAAGLAYVVVDEIAGEGNFVAIWAFLETNGIPGLQRPVSGGLLGETDLCGTCIAQCDSLFL